MKVISRLTISLGLGLFSVVSTIACGGASAPARPSSAAVDQSAVGKNRCVVDGDEAKLFLVEWDATDLASFEAQAARDVVFVRYESCQMKVLHGCSDDGIAGRYGAYSTPQMTSGNVEGLSVKTEDELYAKLPLGAATFGGELSKGKALDLKYFVAGTAASTRDLIYRADLAANARCTGATHFVASYNLGAFTLSSVDTLKAGASAAAFGASGGAKHTQSTDALKRGGDLATCSSFDQHACKVPIRALLRRIADGARPAPAEGAAADTTGVTNQANAMMQSAQLRASAEQKLMAGDADGCLRDLARAGQAPDPQTNMLRAKCEMRAGKCDEGKKHYREAKAAWTRQFDRTGLQNDATLDAEAGEVAKQWCPSSAAGGVSVQQGAIGLLQKIVQAQGAKDAQACIDNGRALAKLVAAGAASDPSVKQASGGLQAAAQCAADGGRCGEAKELYVTFVKAFFGNADPRFADAAFQQKFPACAGK
jgi:hypothetical protein